MKTWRLVSIEGFVRRDVAAEMREVLAAHYPGVLAQVDAALALAPEQRASWRPPPLAEVPDDVLEVARRVLRQVITHFESTDAKQGRASSLAKTSLDALKIIDTMEGRRAPAERPDEVEARLVEARDRAVGKMLPALPAALAKYQADRAALDAWAVEVMGSHLGGELARRLDAMLGQAPQP